MENGDIRYKVKFIIYVILALLTPWSTLFTSTSPEKIANMLWPEWIGVLISSIVAGLIAARAYMDTSSGVKVADKEWEEYLSDLNKESDKKAKEMLANAGVKSDTTIQPISKV